MLMMMIIQIALRTTTIDENNEAVKQMISDNRRITISNVAVDNGISFRSCQVIFTVVLGMKRAAAKIVEKFLDFEQKQCWMDIDPDLLKKVITGDESRVYGCNIESQNRKRHQFKFSQKGTFCSVAIS